MKKLLILLLLVFSMTMAVTGCLSVTVPTSYSGADSSVSSVITSDSSSVKPSSSNIKPSSSSVKPSSSSIKPSSSSVKPSSSSAKPSSSSTKPSSSSVVAKFLITFKNGQETLQETSFVKGEKIVYTGETPAKASTVEYTYTFKGWSLTENGSVVDLTTQTVSKATTYYAVFTQAVRKYTITWNVEGTKTTTSVEYGKAPTTTLKPTKTATAEYTYTFAGWSLTSGGNVVDLTTQTVSKATTYYAVFTQAVRKYTVTWNVEGTKTTTSVEYGKEPTTTLKPTKTATAEYTYTFAGWSTTSGGNVVDLTTQTIKANTTYYAVFTQTTRKYTVTWDVNGKKTTTSVQYGKAPTTTLKPTKASTAQYTYTFKGWSTTENGNVVDLTTQTIKSNITYYAVFNSTIRTYTVRFSVDGIVVQNETLEYGTTIKYNFGTPYLQGHEFLGWTKTNSTMGEIVSSFGTVEKNTSFYALFTDLSVWDGTIPTLASGATVDTLFKKDNSGNYLIENATDLSELSALSNGKNFGSGLKFKLLMNIDLSANNWLPICDDNTVKGNWNASYYAFCGTFDGDNKTITFNENYTKEGLQLGLFRALGSGANISNIIFNGKATVGGYYGPVAGAIIGDNVKISNVTNNVNITSIMTPSTTPTALDKYANVILGGVVGLVEESVGQNIIFENCRNNGTITGVNQSRNLGGIVANVKRGNTVNFINCSNTASITGGAYIGGLAGSVELWGTGVSTKAYITNCSKMATITGYTLSGVSKIATESYGVAEPYVGNLIGYHSTSIITSVWDGTIPTLASGATVDTLFTKDSSGYYLIQSAQDLATLSALSNGKDFGSGLKFKQTINIDLSANNWLPICDDNTVKGNWKASYYAFCGTYDGNNKTITFNENYSKDGLQLGLFRALGSDANISNIIFNGKATVGGYYGPVAGIIVGDNVKISNVTNNVNITSIMKPSTTPTALDKYANVILGGVVGLVEESVGQNIIFENCRNNGTITGVNQSRNLGGIVANVKRGNTVNFINCSNTASITGGAYAGGIVGIVEQWGTGYTTRIEMTGCTNTATITGYDLDGTKKTATIEIGSASPYLGLLIGVNHATGTSSVWDGTYPTLASGATVDTLFTKDSSGNYLIQSAQDLATLSVLSRGVDFGSGLKFKVTSDIDMSAGEWVPICNRGTASTPNYSSWTWKYFLGTFDGNGHTITIKMDITSDTAGMAGALFEGIKGSVSNLVIKGSIKVKTRAGALCYMASGATISNITSYTSITATASGTVYLGGIVGAIDKVDSVTTITNCKNYSVVFADALGNNVGGIVGSVGKGFKIVNCVNKGNITGGANVGGIIGYVANTITSFEVTSCTNSGVVKAGNIVSDIDYGTNANGRGGLLVGNYGCKKFTIKFSVNGTIT